MDTYVPQPIVFNFTPTAAVPDIYCTDDERS